MKKCLFLIGSLLLFSCSFNSLEVKEASKKSSLNERGAIFSNLVQLVNETFDGATRKENFKVLHPQDDDLYMIKFNNSKTDCIWANTGFIEDLASRNAASSAYLNNNKKISAPEETLLDKLKKDLGNYLKDDSSRASSTSFKVQKKNATVGNQKKVYLINKNEFVQRNATCEYVGNNCVIWFVNNGKRTLNFSKYDFQRLAATFDAVCKIEEEYFGSHIYTKSAFKNTINPYDKIDIILADIEEDMQIGGTCGYFYGGDMLDIEGSNKSEVIYIDSYNYKADPNMALPVLIHEYSHLLTHVQKEVINGHRMDAWFTEMLAMLAEDMFEYIFNMNPSSSPKARVDEFILYHSAGFGNWKNSTVDYANAYVFGAYLARNYGGPELIAEIAKNAYANEESITKALKVFYPNRKIDFNYVLANEPLIFFENSGISLNKTVLSKKDDGVCFTGFDVFQDARCGSINIKEWWWCFPVTFVETFNNGSRKININDIMNLSGEMEDQFGLGCYGFSVRNIGRNIEDFTVTSFNKEGINYYFSF